MYLFCFGKEYIKMIIYSCIDRIEYETLMEKGFLECAPKLTEMPSESVEFTHALRDKIIGTWDRIFDIYAENDYALYPNDYKSIQAVFWQIRKDNILDVKEIYVDEEAYHDYHRCLM